MVTKRQEWNEFDPTDRAPSTIQRYMDACEAYLVEPPAHVEREEYVLSTRHATIELIDKTKTIGLDEAHLRVVQRAACYVCSERFECAANNFVRANPFTRSQYMLLCDGCAGRLGDHDGA